MATDTEINMAHSMGWQAIHHLAGRLQTLAVTAITLDAAPVAQVEAVVRQSVVPVLDTLHDMLVGIEFFNDDDGRKIASALKLLNQFKK